MRVGVPPTTTEIPFDRQGCGGCFQPHDAPRRPGNRAGRIRIQLRQQILPVAAGTQRGIPDLFGQGQPARFVPPSDFPLALNPRLVFLFAHGWRLAQPAAPASLIPIASREPLSGRERHAAPAPAERGTTLGRLRERPRTEAAWSRSSRQIVGDAHAMAIHHFPALPAREEQDQDDDERQDEAGRHNGRAAVLIP